MNQTFDLKRFNNYFVYFLKTGIRHHMAIVGALLGFALLMVIVPELMFDMCRKAYEGGPYNYFNDGYDPMWGMEQGVFGVMIVVILTVSASMMFSDFGDKASRLDALMLPASALEKFVARWIIFVPLTAVVSVIGFEVIDMVRCMVVTMKYGNLDSIHFIGLELLRNNSLADMTVISYFWLYISFFVLGAIVWPRLSVVKTFGAGILLWTAYMLWTVFLFTNLVKGYNSDGLLEKIDGDTILVVFDAVMIAISLVLYVIAYYRLKEIELVQRW